MKQCKYKKELKKVGYYDLLFLDTSITAMLIGKLPTDWKGNILDFLNTDLSDDCKVNLSILSKKLDNEIHYEILIWCLKQVENKNNIKVLGIKKTKDCLKKWIDIEPMYADKFTLRRSIEMSYLDVNESLDKSLLLLATGYDLQASTLNTVRFLIKNNFFTYQDILNKIKKEIGKYNYT